MRSTRRQGGQPSEEAIRRRREIGVPDDLLHEPVWIIAKYLGITQGQLKTRLYGSPRKKRLINPPKD